MKSKPKTTTTLDPLRIEGSVIDPASGRVCATAADIARGACVHPSTVARVTRARRHAGGRYLDVADVLAELANARHRGRPRRVDGNWGEATSQPHTTPPL